MKKMLLLIFALFAFYLVTGQQPPTWNNPQNGNGTGSRQFWSRSGNTNQQGTNNWFGTLWNSPIYTYTDRTPRMKLNGTFAGVSPQYVINGYGSTQGVNTSGYLLLGEEINVAGSSLFANMGAFSLLHLNGGDQSTVQQLGFRPWMKTGITLTDHTDLSYIGLRRVQGGGINETEMTIAWSNDPQGLFGPDDMVFRFMEGGNVNGNPYANSFDDPKYASDLDGRHIARFTADAKLGIGVDFNNSYRPTHTLHAQGNGRFECVPDAVGAGCEGVYDNFSEYILLGNQVSSDPDDIELRKIPFSGDSGDVLLGDGTWGPAGGGDDQIIENITLGNGNGTTLCIEIENGNTECIDLAALQDGTGTDDQTITLFDYNNGILTIEIEDGNIDSVDLSALINTPDLDEQRLYFNGNNQLCITNGNCITLPTGVTGTTVSADNGLTTQVAGSNTNVQLGGALLHNTTVDLEGYNLLFSNKGRFSVGANLGAKFNVKTDGATGKAVQIDNHNSQLLMRILENGYQESHTYQNSYTFIHENHMASGTVEGGIFRTRFTGSTSPFVRGINAQVLGNFSGQANAYIATIQNNHSGAHNVCLYANLRNNLARNTGAAFNLSGAAGGNTGLRNEIYVLDNSGDNHGHFVRLLKNSQNETGTGVTNYGVRSLVLNASANSVDYGVYAYSARVANSWAGFFGGNVEVVGDLTYHGQLIHSSDRKLKKDIQTLEAANEILMQLKPSTYTFRTEEFKSMGLPANKQFGLIAQEVEEVLPELVSAEHHPEQRDGEGNIIAKEVDFKGVNYTAFIPILIKGYQEQTTLIEAQKTQIESLEERISKMERLLDGIGFTEQKAETTTEMTQEVVLNNQDYIVLEQNAPNPFAEKTVIHYQIPSDIQSAQMRFWGPQGKEIQTVELTTRGKGSLIVYGKDLSNGMYTYSLILDGQGFQTKKMVKQ